MNKVVAIARASLFRVTMLSVFAFACSAQSPRPQVANSSGLLGVAYRPDGNGLVTWGVDAIQIWQVSSGRVARTISLGRNVPGLVAISPDGKWIAAAVAGRVDVYDFEQGTLARAIPLADPQAKKDSTRPGGLPGPIDQDETPSALAFNAEGSQILVRTETRVQVRNTADGRLVRQFALPAGHAQGATFSKQGDRLLLYQKSGLELWDTLIGRRIASWGGSGMMSPDGGTVALLEGDGSAAPNFIRSRIVDVASGKDPVVLDAFVLCFTPDGKRVLATQDVPRAADSDEAREKAMSSMRFFVRDLNSGNEVALGALKLEFFPLPPASFAPDGEHMAVVQGGSVAIISLSGEPARRLEPGGVKVDSDLETRDSPASVTFGLHSAFSPDGRWLAARSPDGPVEFFDLTTGARSSLHAGALGSGPVSFASKGRFLAFFDEEGARLFDLATGNLTKLVKGVPGFGSSIADVYMSGFGEAGEVAIWNLETGEVNRLADYSAERFAGMTPQQAFAAMNGILPPIAVSPDGTRFAAMETVAMETMARVPPPSAGLRRRLARAAPVIGGIVENKELSAVSTGPRTQLSIFDARTKTRLVALENHSGDGNFAGSNLIFSPDGRYLAAGGVFLGTRPDQVQTFNILTGPKMKTAQLADPVKIWDARTGKPQPALQGDIGGITVLAFSPGGDLLATAAGSLESAKQPDQVTVWDVATGRARYRLKGNSSRIGSIAFSRDAQLLAVSGSDGVTHFWQMGNGDASGSLTLFPGGDWLVVAVDGQFDGSPDAWSRVSWRESASLEAGPVERYFNEFYRPGLLAEIVAGQKLPAVPVVTSIDRRQPVVKIVAPATTTERAIRVRLEIEDPGSGVQDVRLFRDGLLVRTWRGEQRAGAGGMIALEAEVLVRGDRNVLTAYCFNRQNVKSLDARATVRGADLLKRKGTAWILAIGVDRYANPEFNLNYSVADQQLFESQLHTDLQKTAAFERIEVIRLSNEQATRASILAALDRLGRAGGVQPEDAVFVYFAGHGLARGTGTC